MPQHSKSGRDALSLLQQLKVCCQSGLGFRFHFAKHRRRKIQIVLGTQNNTLLDRSKCVYIRDNMAKLKDVLNKTDVTVLCSRETMHTNWRFYKLAKFAGFAALLKDVPMGCKDAVLPRILLKN